MSPIITNSSNLRAHNEQYDYVQWCIDHSYANNDPTERDIDLITKRFMVVCFAAIQSSVVTATNLLLDLAASPLTPSYFESLRNEVKTELSAGNGIWSKQVLARMTSLDSGLRESMRLWGFVSRGVLKEVVAKEGVTTPDGLHIPYGVKVGVHQNPIHHDEDIYPNAQVFEPLRFCPKVDSDTEGSTCEKKPDTPRGIPLVSTSKTWMGFSHGKHAW